MKVKIEEPLTIASLAELCGKLYEGLDGGLFSDPDDMTLDQSIAALREILGAVSSMINSVDNYLYLLPGKKREKAEEPEARPA